MKRFAGGGRKHWQLAYCLGLLDPIPDTGTSTNGAAPCVNLSLMASNALAACLPLFLKQVLARTGLSPA